jgi:hypothetical protein
MASNKDEVQNFYELRQGFEGMADFAGAALRFLDHHGIGILYGGRGRGPTAALGGSTNGRAKVRVKSASLNALREQVKRHYTKRRPQPVAATVGSAERRYRNREQSLAILDALDRVEPRPVIPEGLRKIGALVRRGYAKKKHDGYIRTAKPFVVGRPVVSDENAALTITEAAKLLKTSDSHVRTLIKQKQITARHESRPRAGGGIKPMMITVVDREEIRRHAEKAAAGPVATAQES